MKWSHSILENFNKTKITNKINYFNQNVKLYYDSHVCLYRKYRISIQDFVAWFTCGTWFLDTWGGCKVKEQRAKGGPVVGKIWNTKSEKKNFWCIMF